MTISHPPIDPRVAPGQPAMARSEAPDDQGEATASREVASEDPGEERGQGQGDDEGGRGWAEVPTRWYQRTSVRVGLALLVLAVGVAICPYPLYVTSECLILPTERVKLRPTVGGIIDEILVDEGQEVKQGQIVAKLDGRELRAKKREAEAELERLSAELERLRHGSRPEELEQQRAVVAARASDAAFAASEARRRQLMLESGVESRQQVEEGRRNLRMKREAHAEAKAGLRLLRAGSRREDIAAKEAQLAGARAQLELVDDQLERLLLRSPIDGVVLTPRFRERLHERVEAGGLACEIASTRVMRAEIMVPEREADTIRVAMPAVIKVESYPTRPFVGEVNFIAPAVEVAESENRIRVVAELGNEAGLLKQNMTGYGEVNCGRRMLIDLATRRLLRWVRVRFLL